MTTPNNASKKLYEQQLEEYRLRTQQVRQTIQSIESHITWLRDRMDTAHERHASALDDYSKVTKARDELVALMLREGIEPSEE